MLQSLSPRSSFGLCHSFRFCHSSFGFAKRVSWKVSPPAWPLPLPGPCRVFLLTAMSLAVTTAALPAQIPSPAPDEPKPASLSPPLREYRDFAMNHDGNPLRGNELFSSQQRTACVKCHSVDGGSGKAGPDLFAIGDKFPRSDLIDALLEPSSFIAIGYGTTIVETMSGEEHHGIL